MERAIIVADDSTIIQNIVKNALKDKLVVLSASNGKEALDIIVNNREYDLVGMLLDLNMPDYNGFMVLNYFKNSNLFIKIPISIISGDDSKETIDRAFTYGITDMLNKPFSAENIRNAVDKMIQLRTM